MRTHNRYSPLNCLILCALLVAACAAPAAPVANEDTTVAESSDETTSTDRGSLRIAHFLGFGGAESIDPYAGPRFLEVITAVYSRLIRPDEHGFASPELATSWLASEDATVWTIKLQAGVTFHDGSTFDAADVVYSFNRILDPENRFPVASTLAVIESIEANDELTVLFNLNTSYADFPLLLMDYRARIIPEDSGDTIAETGIGTGPFMLEELDVEGITTLLANDAYWEGMPGVARIEISAIADADARVQAMLGGQIDLLGVGSAQRALFEGNAQFAIQEIPVVTEWAGFTMRTDTAPFDDVRVRKALRMAVDREAMATLVLGNGMGTITCDNPVLPTDPYRANLECPQDIEGAKALLTEAGYPDGIDVDLHVVPFYSTMAEAYQQQVADAGITVNLVMEAADGYWNDVWMVEPFFATSWGTRITDQYLNELYRSDSPWNESYWQNPAFDALLDDARAELDFEARKALYAQAQEQLWEETGTFIPFHQDVTIRVTAANVQGLAPVDAFNIRWQDVRLGD